MKGCEGGLEGEKKVTLLTEEYHNFWNQISNHEKDSLELLVSLHTRKSNRIVVIVYDILTLVYNLLLINLAIHSIARLNSIHYLRDFS